MVNAMRAESLDYAWCLTIAALGAFLLWCGLGPLDGGARALLAVPASSSEFESLSAFALMVLGLLVLGWWAVGLAAALTASVMARSGHTEAARRTARLSPAFMRRLVAALLGANLLLSPAAHAASAPASAPIVAAKATGVPVPYWATDVGTRDTVAESAVNPRATAGAPDPGWRAEKPAAPMDRVLGGSAPSDSGRDVVVTRGDSLWSIAARSLGGDATEAEIAREWPRWYGANRHTIGSDPDHLSVGSILIPPAG